MLNLWRIFNLSEMRDTATRWRCCCAEPPEPFEYQPTAAAAGRSSASASELACEGKRHLVVLVIHWSARVRKSCIALFPSDSNYVTRVRDLVRRIAFVLTE